MDISRYIEGGTRLSAEELRPGLSAITFQAEREIYIYIHACVCVSLSIEIRYEKSMYVSTRPRCRRDCQKGEGDRVVYDAFASSLSRWKDAKEVGMIEFGLSTGRGGGSILE